MFAAAPLTPQEALLRGLLELQSGTYLGSASATQLNLRRLAELPQFFAPQAPLSLSNGVAGLAHLVPALPPRILLHFGAKLVPGLHIWPHTREEPGNYDAGHCMMHGGGAFGIIKGSLDLTQQPHQGDASGPNGHGTSFGTLIVYMLDQGAGVLLPMGYYPDYPHSHMACMKALRLLYSRWLMAVYGLLVA